MNARLDPAPLLAESRWLANLARQLVGDAAEAEELAQETLATALRTPPRMDRPVRAWLAQAMRNRLVDRIRHDAARTQRERARARTEAQPSTFDVVAKAEIHRELVQAVLALAEPYRTTVLLRFFEDLSPRVIAQRMESNVETVNSRIQRALAMLRGALDKSHSRTEWLAAITPLLHDGTGPTTWGVGVTLMKGSLWLSLVAAALVAVVAWAWMRHPPSEEYERVASTRIADPASLGEPVRPIERSLTAREASTLDSREALASPNAPTQADPTLAAGQAALRVRVLDVEGQGRPGVLLGIEAREGRAAKELGRSGVGGRAELELPSGADSIGSVDLVWSTVLAASARTTAANEALILVAPRLDFAGRVVDDSGAPLPKAEVSAHPPRAFGANLGVVLDYSVAREWRTRSDSDGAFALSNVPSVAHAALHVALSGYETTVVPMPTFPDGSLRIVLRRPERASGVVHGVVVDPVGAVVEGARVSAGGVVASTSEDGTFALDVSTGELFSRITAVAPGFQPAVHDVELHGGQPQWPARVVLRLGPVPLLIAGRIVDSSGKSVEGARVWISDPLVLGHEDGDVLLAENALAGRGKSFWTFETTVADGRFELAGLSDRKYHVVAMDERTLVRAEKEHVRAGERALEIVLDRDVHATVRGRVIARDGTPIPSVSVKFQRPVLEVAVPGGTRDEWLDSKSVTTDENGAFILHDVPREGVEIFAWGDPILFSGKILERDADPLAFKLQVDRRMHVQVELEPPIDRADELQILDSSGRPMLLRVMRGEAAFTSRRSSIEHGRSQILSLGENAQEILFLRSGVEAGRIPVRLTAVGVHRIRW